MKKKILIFFVVFILISTSLTGCVQKDNTVASANSEDDESQNQEENYTPVEIMKAEKKTISNITTINGKVYADKEVMVFPKVPGTVESVNVKEGVRINEGDVLFILDKEDIHQQVEQAQVNLNMAKANYRLTEERISAAKESLERTRKINESVLNNAMENLKNTRELYEAGAISKSQLDQAELGYEQQEAQLQAQLEQAEIAASDNGLDVAKAQLKQAELAYNQAADALEDTTVTAPISGIVASVSVVEGGMAVNTQPAVTIIDINKVYIRIDVVDSIVNSIMNGQKVKIDIPAVSDASFAGVVDSVSPVVDQRTQLYPIKIYLDNKEGLLKPGMFATASLDLNVKKDVLVIPSEAVVFKNGKNMIYVVEGDKAVEREITIGLDTGEYIEVVEGLSEDEMVIVKGQDYVENGSRIKVVGGNEA